ncbi:MAG TPA: hypothetical protein VNW04_19360 [Puia sp.]|jgi:hypothetical protein|nr:hypothetical protein [Puia sp.]
MKSGYPYLLSLLAGLCFLTAGAQPVFNRIDTTMKIGKVGYRVSCRNKSITDNPATITPIGMDAEVRPFPLPLKGRISGTQVDDLNGDGYPDLVLFVFTDSNAVNGSVICIMSKGNKSLAPCYLPDIAYDPKVNKGYKGHDTFSLLEGSLIQRFPIFNPGDSTNNPTGGTRTLMYQVGKGDGSGFKFNRIRFYDTK